MEPRRVVIIEDHPLLAAGLQAGLEQSGAEVDLLDPRVGPDQLLNTISSRRPDCVVVDLGLPFSGGGLALIRPLVGATNRVVVLTGEADRQRLARASGEGAEVVLSKAEPLADIVDVILRVANGQVVRAGQQGSLAAELHRYEAEQNKLYAPFAGLSPRERQVLAGLMNGHGPSTLAERHYVSVATIRAQIRSVLGKLGVRSQLEAVVLAHKNRWRFEEDQP
ncbi:MAG: response regulator transcription factor [Actinomycetia bacterium]|nr:response regulator transcription factor [Actinomycetes bacterium]MCP4225485.1 response regulator transcription factor [Actinomycetes bacterium]MCP5034648.1 response regulator transcription factor [Actinomycetes bacterium]